MPPRAVRPPRNATDRELGQQSHHILDTLNNGQGLNGTWAQDKQLEWALYKWFLLFRSGTRPTDNLLVKSRYQTNTLVNF